jgi:glycosyltransferase involved in cell wall biosynthesis
LCAIALEPSRKFGSLEEQLLVLAREFRSRGGLFLPLYICPPGTGKARPFEEAGLPHECLDLRRFQWRTLWRLVRLVKRNRIKVINWNFTHPLANPYLWFLTVLCPTVRHYFTDHISRPSPPQRTPGYLKRTAKRWLMRRYRKLLCVSRFVLGCYSDGGKWSNLHHYPHGINTRRFRPDPEARAAVRKRLNAEGRFVVLTVAHLIRVKGIDVVIRALAELPEPVVLWVIGDGEEAGSLRKLAKSLGVAGRVTFLGLQTHVEPFMQAADCFACPSRWEKAAGLVNLEASSCGLPVIASRIGGIPEYVEEGVTGFLIPSGDAGALACHVVRLHQDPVLCRTLGRQARAWAEARFCVENRINDFLDVYRFPS